MFNYVTCIVSIQNYLNNSCKRFYFVRYSLKNTFTALVLSYNVKHLQYIQLLTEMY